MELRDYLFDAREMCSPRVLPERHIYNEGASSAPLATAERPHLTAEHDENNLQSVASMPLTFLDRLANFFHLQTYTSFQLD